MEPPYKERIPGSAVLFCMPEPGHFQRLVPLIAELARGGVSAHVLTHRSFEGPVRRAGGRFVDLFAGHPVEAADAESFPVPCRYVSFAAHYADSITRLAERLGPTLVIYDTFAVIGLLVARRLGLPYVNVCAGHNMVPARFLEMLTVDPRVRVSPACERAAARLRDEHGVADATPFSYVAMLSPHLNLYCEPPEFLDEAERRTFEPLAFFGSLPRWTPSSRRPRATDGVRVYASFGTVVWRYYAREALAALAAISSAVAGIPRARLRVSLGRAGIAPEQVSALSRENVRIEPYVDQPTVLRETDVFITHQGLNSTHEAIAAEVPMLSYPFFWDQPALATKCQALGLAVALADSPRAAIGPADVARGLASVAQRRTPMREALARAAGWEKRVVEERQLVIERIKRLL
ncbi:MAG: glycosyltransferase family 1 protein [Acidobacteria bacterium]|nr:glycosyltransferase family 1 protein [Acidobacteriota bacterium]